MGLDLDKSDWKTFRFDQIAAMVSERVDPSETDADIYVGLEHLDPESLHIKRFGAPADVKGTKLKVYPGDVIFGRRRAYQRKAAIAEFEGICSAHAMVLRAKVEVIDPKLFPFFLHSDTFMHRAIDISVGSLSPTINWKTLRKQEFLLPPKDQQARIAELLWAGDAVVEREQNLLQRVNSFQHALWNNSVSGFEKIKIKKIGKVSNGTTPSKRQSKYWENGTIPWLPTGKVHDKFISASDMYITDEAIDDKKAKIFPKGSTLVAMIGQGKTRGSAAMLLINSAINQNFACIIPQKIDSLFLFYSLYFSYDSLRGTSQGSHQGALNCNLIKNFEIRFPPYEVQTKVGTILQSAEKSTNEVLQKILKSKELQKFLINQIF